MRGLLAILLLATAAACTLVHAQQPAGTQSATTQPVRFAWIDVTIDPQGRPLAAYQFELKTVAGDVKIVGIEGGEHAAFSEPPYYDPAALSNNRVIIAAFHTGKDLPAGPTRVARIHVRVAGPVAPEFSTDLQVAAGAEG